MGQPETSDRACNLKMNGALAAPKGVKAARHAPTLGGGGLEWAQRLARESPELATTFRGF